MEINIPDVMAEVEVVFARYENALVTNDVVTLESLFWDDPKTIRYGATENLYGIDEIRAFRRGRSPVGLFRRLQRTVITTFGRDFATANTPLYPRKRTGTDWTTKPDLAPPARRLEGGIRPR